MLFEKAQQKSHRVAVRSNCLLAGILLGDEVLAEIVLNELRERW
jgi:hypothetical protein